MEDLPNTFSWYAPNAETFIRAGNFAKVTVSGNGTRTCVQQFRGFFGGHVCRGRHVCHGSRYREREQVKQYNASPPFLTA